MGNFENEIAYPSENDWKLRNDEQLEGQARLDEMLSHHTPIDSLPDPQIVDTGWPMDGLPGPLYPYTVEPDSPDSGN